MSISNIPVRVLMVVQNACYPQDQRVKREAETLVAAGYGVCVIAPRRQGQTFHEVRDGVAIYRYPEPWPSHSLGGYLLEYTYSILAIWLLAVWVFLRRGFDVIHVANPPDMLFLIAAPFKLLGKRFVYDHHDLCPELYSQRFCRSDAPMIGFLKVLERLSCWMADRVITTNASHRELEMQRDRVAKERIAIVRNGPDLQQFRVVKPDPTLRSRSSNVIVYAGITGFQDGLDFLCRALRHLKIDLGREDFCCAIMGDGAALPSIKKLACDLKIDDKVWFLGWVGTPDLYRSYLAAADICVSPEPSNRYNDRSTLIKVLEYMAAGKPIVAFDLPESRFSAGGAALYAPNNNELEFARALDHLMDNPVQRQQMGEFGKTRIQQLDWQHSAPALLQAYDTLFPSRVQARAAARAAQ